MSQGNPDISFVNQPAPPRKLTFQFSIRGIMIATAVVALILGSLAAPEVVGIALIMAFVAVTTVLVISTVAARGWFRAFAIGALVPHVLTYLLLLDGPGRASGVVIALLFSLLISTAIGFVAAVTHGFLLRRGGKVVVPNIPFIRNWLTNE